MDPRSLHGLPFGIGSLPISDPDAACRLVLKYFPLTPFSPELPRRDWRESIGYIQSEGLPGVVVDHATEKIFVDTWRDLSGEFTAFYESYMAGRIDRLAMSRGYAAGLHALLDAVRSTDDKPLVIKGQLSGPTTYGLILKDAGGRPMLYDEQYMDVLVKSTVLKARWMAREIRRAGAEPVIFFDEPMLQSIGSASVPIDRAQVIDHLTEVADGVDCLTGAHCCGNTDWSILMATTIDILAFDAFRFSETLALYPEQLRDFLGRGGLLAWGIVPASEAADQQSVGDLMARLDEAFDTVSRAGIDRESLRRVALVTPSCGLASLPENTAEHALDLTRRISDRLRSL